MPTLEILCRFQSQDPDRVLAMIAAVNVNEGEPDGNDFTIDSDTSQIIATGARRSLVITPGPRLTARCPTDALLDEFLINLYRGKFDAQLCSACEYAIT